MFYIRGMIVPQPGTLLIADPFLKDPNFLRTVVLICRHSREEGSFGFTLNRLYDLTLGELIPEMEGFENPIFIGGPVQMDSLHFIHQYPEYFNDCEKIDHNIFWGGDFEKLKLLMKGKVIDEQKIKFFIGYSGWATGQLELEIEEKSWLSVKGTGNIVFNTALGDIWKASLVQLGGNYEKLVHYPTDPQLN